MEAFKSTLEEAKYADVILHVVDASNPQMDEQMHTVYETLRSLEVGRKPVVTVFNKQDRISGEEILRDFQADCTVKASAKTGEGLSELLEALEAVLREQKIAVECVYDYRDTAKIQLIRKYGELIEEDYREDGIFVRGYVPADIWGKAAPSDVLARHGEDAAPGDSENRRR